MSATLTAASLVYPANDSSTSMLLPSVVRALLIINLSSGTGQSRSTAEKLAAQFKEGLAILSDVEVEFVTDHAAARACAAAFVGKSDAPALLVAGGGGGTLRALIDGACDSNASKDLPGPERVIFGALRLGSGNLLAKHLGAPTDPFVTLDGLLANLKLGRTTPCCVVRCQTWTRSGASEIHHAVSLGGLGQFGRIPSDLARWHTRFPMVRKIAARLIGLEKVNNFEYELAFFIRSLSCLLFSDRAETVEIKFQNQTERFRLFAGVVMNFPVNALPFEPGITSADEALSVYLVPLRGRLSSLRQLLIPQTLVSRIRCLRLEKHQRLDIRSIDPESLEFFLDEDPVTSYGRISLEVAGSVSFVPGPGYQQNPEPGVFR